MQDLYALYKKFKEISISEKELIAEEKFAVLNEKLTAKNEIIEQIEAVNQQEYFAKLAFSLSQEELAEKKEELICLLKEIAELQSENMKKLELKKSSNKEKMLSLYSREKSIKGYLSPDKYEAKFFDEKT